MRLPNPAWESTKFRGLERSSLPERKQQWPKFQFSSVWSGPRTARSNQRLPLCSHFSNFAFLASAETAPSIQRWNVTFMLILQNRSSTLRLFCWPLWKSYSYFQRLEQYPPTGLKHFDGPLKPKLAFLADNLILPGYPYHGRRPT